MHKVVHVATDIDQWRWHHAINDNGILHLRPNYTRLFFFIFLYWTTFIGDCFVYFSQLVKSGVATPLPKKKRRKKAVSQQIDRYTGMLLILYV